MANLIIFAIGLLFACQSVLAYPQEDRFSGSEGETHDADIQLPANNFEEPPGYAECNRNCLTVSNFNPVCGSNRVTYDNPARLNCAKICGLDIVELYMGTCRPSAGGK